MPSLSMLLWDIWKEKLRRDSADKTLPGKCRLTRKTEEVNPQMEGP
jgi:hypothetical protein